MPALEIVQENGSKITDFKYVSHKIYKGKPGLKGLPATYVESEDEADTLELTLRDELLRVDMTLLYTIFGHENAIARSARFENRGGETYQITRAMSLCLDLPDDEYEWIQFSGAWGAGAPCKDQDAAAGDPVCGKRQRGVRPFPQSICHAQKAYSR